MTRGSDPGLHAARTPRWVPSGRDDPVLTPWAAAAGVLAESIAPRRTRRRPRNRVEANRRGTQVAEAIADDPVGKAPRRVSTSGRWRERRKTPITRRLSLCWEAAEADVERAIADGRLSPVPSK